MSISNAELIKDSQALKSPCHGPEVGFKAKENKDKFAFLPRQLGRLVNSNKSLSVFSVFGSLAGLEIGLRTDRRYGLSSEETALDDFVSFYNINNNLIPRNTNTRASKEEEVLVPVTIARPISI